MALITLRPAYKDRASAQAARLSPLGGRASASVSVLHEGGHIDSYAAHTREVVFIAPEAQEIDTFGELSPAVAPHADVFYLPADADADGLARILLDYDDLDAVYVILAGQDAPETDVDARRDHPSDLRPADGPAVNAAGPNTRRDDRMSDVQADVMQTGVMGGSGKGPSEILRTVWAAVDLFSDARAGLSSDRLLSEA